jgi:hypothetical protein
VDQRSTRQKLESVLSDLGPVSGLPVDPITALCQIFEFFQNPGASIKPGWTHAELMWINKNISADPCRQQGGAPQRTDCKQKVPSCTGMRFRSGEGSVFQAWRLPFGASFLSVSTESYARHCRLQAAGLVRPSLSFLSFQKASLGIIGCWHAVLEWWGLRFSGMEAAS